VLDLDPRRRAAELSTNLLVCGDERVCLQNGVHLDDHRGADRLGFADGILRGHELGRRLVDVNPRTGNDIVDGHDLTTAVQRLADDGPVDRGRSLLHRHRIGKTP
jgi:hypothetical protein